MPDSLPPCGSRCICGQAGLQFHSHAPVMHVHCCCADCRQAMEWVASVGGPPMTSAVTHAMYFRNDLAMPDAVTLSLLYPVKLRSNGRTIRLVTKCCHSVLAIDHPYYGGNVICIHPDHCRLYAPPIEALGRIFSTGWDQAHDGAMPEATARLADLSADWAKFDRVVKHPVGPRSGVSLQDVLALLPPPLDLSLTDGARLLSGISPKGI